MNSIQKKIVQYLSGRIFSGALAPGEMIEKESTLAEKFSTSKMNAKAAVNFLAKRGLVRRKRHAGSFVSKVADSAFARDVLAGGEKIVFLLCSRNCTRIHWDENTREKFCKTARKYAFTPFVLFLPSEKKALEKLLDFLADFQPEALTVLDDNFDHLLLFEVRHSFEKFSCPIVFLNRFGAGAPLHIPKSKSLDIDHFQNGYLAGKVALTLPEITAFTVNNVVLGYSLERESIHCRDKYDGIHTAFQEAAKEIPRDFSWEHASLTKLAEAVKMEKNPVILALNQEIGAKVYKFFAARNLFPPSSYRLITIEEQKQYENFAFSTIAVSKEKTGGILAELACGKIGGIFPGESFSLRIQGEILLRKTF